MYLREGQPGDVDGQGLVEPHVGPGPEPEDDPDDDDQDGRCIAQLARRPGGVLSATRSGCPTGGRRPGRSSTGSRLIAGAGASTAVAGLSSTRSIGCRW